MMIETDKWRTEGFTVEEMKSIQCENGSFTCGLRRRLKLKDGKCKLCKQFDHQEILNDFISKNLKGLNIGSGDDYAYEEAFMKYVNQQRKVWIDFIKFIDNRLKDKYTSKR